MLLSRAKIVYSPIRSGKYKVVAEIQESIVDYYYTLIPKGKAIKNKSRPQITILNTNLQSPTKLDKWYNWSGKAAVFHYDGLIKNDEECFWLNIDSDDFCTIREECNLPPFRDGLDCFRLAIGTVIKKEKEETGLSHFVQHEKELQEIMDAQLKEEERNFYSEAIAKGKSMSC